MVVGSMGSAGILRDPQGLVFYLLYDAQYDIPTAETGQVICPTTDATGNQMNRSVALGGPLPKIAGSIWGLAGLRLAHRAAQVPSCANDTWTSRPYVCCSNEKGLNLLSSKPSDF